MLEVGATATRPHRGSSHQNRLGRSNKRSFPEKKRLWRWMATSLNSPISNKIYYPEQKYTKRDVMEFYDGVSSWLLPIYATGHFR